MDAGSNQIDSRWVMDLFRSVGVLQEGHFLLTSGRHSARYLQCARLLQYPAHTAKLCSTLASFFSGRGVEVVVGPAIGAIIIAYETARALGARALFAEREGGRMCLRRGFSIAPGEKVLVVEDVVTTGGSVREVVDLVREQGADVVGVGVLVDRSGGKVDFGTDLAALVRMQIQAYLPEECPLCRRGLELVKPGSRQLPGETRGPCSRKGDAGWKQ